MTDFFKSTDFACPCCGGMDIRVETIDLVERMQDLIEYPLRITSGYRCHRRNSDPAVGGSPQSPHLDGLAVDIACESDSQRWEIVAAAMECGAKGVWIYSSHVHVDLKTRSGNRPRLGLGLKRAG